MKPLRSMQILAYPGTPDLTEAELRDATADYRGFMEEFTTNLFDYLKPPFTDRRSVHLQRFDFLLSMGDYLTVYVKRRPPVPVTLESLAPEMEDLIRSIVGQECIPGECVECGADLQAGSRHGDDCKLNNLLVKIDTARKAAQ